ncbi:MULTISPECIES: hypothetical protein [Clostridia]|jgi:hypothetical protein|uniref:hypothetical protein n=1 Tax=Clostridia TaxID=186801 RepID=UPI0025C1E08C|nr:hypothetical protein [Blautia sp.]
MKKLVIPLLLASMCVLSGCTEKATQSDFKDRVLSESIEEKDYNIQVDSEVKGDCYICGDNENSLMPYFRKSGMIGLVCLNTMDISNLDTRAYSDDGTEVLENGTMGIMTSGHGDGECMFHISGMPGRGIFEASVTYDDGSGLDFDKAKQFLCQKCLDKVCEMYKEEMEWSDGNGRLPEVFIVDFATNELYAIGNHRVGFWIRDFWIRVDHKENEEEIMAIYAPEGKME